MMALHNGNERTITHLRDLLDQTGWKLTAVHHDTSSAIKFGKVIAIPN